MIGRKASLHYIHFHTSLRPLLLSHLFLFTSHSAAITRSHPLLTPTLIFTHGIPLTVMHTLTLILTPTLTLSHSHSHSLTPSHSHSHPPSPPPGKCRSLCGGCRPQLPVNITGRLCQVCYFVARVTPTRPPHFHWSVFLTTYCNLIQRRRTTWLLYIYICFVSFLCCIEVTRM